LLADRCGQGRLYAYSERDAELAALFRDFEVRARHLGFVCPRGLTWSEYLASVDRASGSVKASAQQAAEALAFVNLYNRVRFGAPQSAGNLGPMRAILPQLRGRPSAD